MPDLNNGIPPHFIVIIPGYMGTQLREARTGDLVWPNVNAIPRNPLQVSNWLDRFCQTMTYPNSDIVAGDIVNEVLFVLPWAKMAEYGRLVDALQAMGYRADPHRFAENERNVYTFGYDWRQDNRLSARQLGAAIERWRSFHPGDSVWIIAHSNGELVARWYIEKEGGKDFVGRLFLIASPWDGAPKAMRMLMNGLDLMWLRRFEPLSVNARSRPVIRSFPSVYQLLPYHKPFISDLRHQPVDPFEQVGWLEEERRNLLVDGRCFNLDLGTALSVETLCFFGRKQPTMTSAVAHIGADGHWDSLDIICTDTGDRTVPEESAVHPQARQALPFAAEHGNIYAAPPVLEFLQWELVDKYVGGTRAITSTQTLAVLFEPDKDIYAPGESIHLRLEISNPAAESAPVPGAVVEGQIAWRQALPGSPVAVQPHSFPGIRLSESQAAPGHYQGLLPAPAVEGYYQLLATAVVPGQPPLTVEELIAVESI